MKAACTYQPLLFTQNYMFVTVHTIVEYTCVNPVLPVHVNSNSYTMRVHYTERGQKSIIICKHLITKGLQFTLKEMYMHVHEYQIYSNILYELLSQILLGII